MPRPVWKATKKKPEEISDKEKGYIVKNNNYLWFWEQFGFSENGDDARRILSDLRIIREQVVIVDRLDPVDKVSVESWGWMRWGFYKLWLTWRTALWKSWPLESWLIQGSQCHQLLGTKSEEFLCRAVRGLDKLWPGARLEVLRKSELPLRKVALLWLHPPVVEYETTMKLISKPARGESSYPIRFQHWKTGTSQWTEQQHTQQVMQSNLQLLLCMLYMEKKVIYLALVQELWLSGFKIQGLCDILS